MKKQFLLLLLAGLVIAFFALDLHRHLTLEAIKAGQAALSGRHEANPAIMLGGYFLAYVLVTALSLPGAAVMTLAGAAIFGFFPSLVLVSFASSIGATLAFLSARFLLRDWVQGRFGDKLQAINQGMAKDGALYLFSLRLVPAFPFFAVNLLMGLTPIPTRTYYWVSQVGMLAGTAVYINAGTQLGKIESLVGIVSPGILLSFTLLGLFPLVAKRMIEWITRRRVYAGWPRPRQFDRNLVVIGAGAGGLVTAYIAAAVKAKVTLIEGAGMGGDCLNSGCVPSKTLIHEARLLRQWREAQALASDGAGSETDFARLMERVQAAIRRVAPHDSPERYRSLGVEVIKGWARITSPWTVEVREEGGSRVLATHAVVIATGAEPVVPLIPGLDTVRFVTSDTLWSLRDLPRRLVVLGGGPIGCELAQAFAALGSRVTLVARSGLLGKEDPEVAALVAEGMAADGIRIYTRTATVRCETMGDEQRLIVRREGAEEEAIACDLLLCALGRRARVTGLGLEELGIAVTAQGTVETDEYLRSRLPNILACGDVVGPYQFTHFAAHQAWYAAVNGLFGGVRSFRADYRVIPRVTFTSPEVAQVGLTETEARARHIAHEVTRFDLGELDRAITEDAARGFVKVLTPPGRDTILGVVIVGKHAGEMLAEFTLAMRHGLGLNKILGTVHPYPTWSEAAKYVAGEWKRAHAPRRLLTWLERYHAWRRG